MSFSLEPPNKIILEWDEENENHIRAHNVEPEEVESVFRQDNKIYRKKKGRITQLVGATKGGRVTTAYEADVTLKRLYRKRGK